MLEQQRNGTLNIHFAFYTTSRGCTQAERRVQVYHLGRKEISRARVQNMSLLSAQLCKLRLTS